MNNETPHLSPLLAGEDYCCLTSTGHATGKPHKVEISKPACARMDELCKLIMNVVM